MTDIAILGSTGSVGVQAVDVVRDSGGRLNVAALAAHRSVEQLAAQARELLTKGATAGTLFFTTTDPLGEYARLSAAGVEVTDEPVERDYGTDFGLRDPFGNHIRIGSRKDRG